MKKSSVASNTSWANLAYNHGFGNHVESEAEKGALPIGRNNPQKCPMGLYAEQLSGTPFTYQKHRNQRSWLYRIMPTCKHGAWVDRTADFPYWISDFQCSKGLKVTPEQLRWAPQKFSDSLFHQSIKTMAGAGSPDLKQGLTISHYSFAKSMTQRRIAMYNSDGDMLIVPQVGTLQVTTEFGKLRVEPKEVLIVPRGVKFSMDIEQGNGRGWIAELFKGHL